MNRYKADNLFRSPVNKLLTDDFSDHYRTFLLRIKYIQTSEKYYSLFSEKPLFLYSFGDIPVICLNTR
jgi:hypothetical protein